MQTKKMFLSVVPSLAMTLSLAMILSLAVALSLGVASCFADPDAASADDSQADNATAGYRQADELAADDAETDETQADETQTDEMQVDETQAVERAALQFYASLNALFTGDVAPMQEIWSHADDVTYMGPVGGFQIGWQQVNDEWQRQAALHLRGQIEPKDIQIVVGDNLASVQCFDVGENLDANGQPEKVSIRATNLFRKENGQWKMISHHTDLLKFLEKEPPLTSGNE